MFWLEWRFIETITVGKLQSQIKNKINNSQLVLKLLSIWNGWPRHSSSATQNKIAELGVKKRFETILTRTTFSCQLAK